MKKSVLFSLLAVLICSLLVAGCGDEPSAEQKQKDMDKAFTILGEQLTRFTKLSPKMDKLSDDLKGKKIDAGQARKNFRAIGDEYGDIGANIKKIAVPSWLSSDDKAKFEELKKQYVEACDAMKAFVPIYVKIMVDDKGTKEDVDKLKEYMAIKNARTKKGAELFAHFEKGTWK